MVRRFSTKQYNIVSSYTTADGTAPSPNKSVARDKAVIPAKGTLISLDQVGSNLLANDTGSAIQGYRIDLYKGVGKAVCSGFTNPMAVGACSPASSACPAAAVQ